MEQVSQLGMLWSRGRAVEKIRKLYHGKVLTQGLLEELLVRCVQIAVQRILKAKLENIKDHLLRAARRAHKVNAHEPIRLVLRQDKLEAKGL